MSPPNQPGENHGTLFVPSPTTSAEYLNIPIEPYIGVGIVERSIHLQNTLRLLGRISQLEGLQLASATERRFQLEKNYAGSLDIVLHNSRLRRVATTEEAKAEFGEAFGRNVANELTSIPPSITDAHVKAGYESFFKDYGGAAGAEAREKKLIQLVRAEVMLAAAVGPTVQTLTETDTVKSSQELKDLDTLGRLRAVQEDPRSRFLPTSNLEKNMSITYLDYLDNPEHPQGIINQLDEIQQAMQRDHEPRMGIRAVTSVVFAMEDFLTNAVVSINGLRKLEVALTEEEILNPQLSVNTLGLDSKYLDGVLAIIRYIDQSEFVGSGEIPKRIRFAPFRSHADRDVEQADPLKNKTVEDPYMARVRAGVVDKYLANRVKNLPNFEVKQLIREAIEDQERRAAFWQSRLSDTQARTYAWRVGAKALEKAL
jgi:hypothetical protein